MIHDQDKSLEGADLCMSRTGRLTTTMAASPVKMKAGWVTKTMQPKNTNHASVMQLSARKKERGDADEVLDGPQSIVIPQAGNRIWAAQAVLSEILKGQKVSIWCT